MTDFALLEIPSNFFAKLCKNDAMNQEVSRMKQGVPGVNQIKIHRETPKIINKIMKHDQAYDHFTSSWIPIPLTKIFLKLEPHHSEEMYSKEIRVVCKGIIGYMDKAVQALRGKRMYAHHMTFICEDNKG